MSNKEGKRLNPFQHALKRPDTYIGSVKTVTREMWVCNEKPENQDQTFRYESAKDEVEDLPLDESEKEEVEDEENESSFKPEVEAVIVRRKIKFNNGLVRCFVEITSNAIDNKWRSQTHNVPMKKIDFVLDRETGYITVTNDGYMIPVKKSKYEYEDYRTGKVTTESLYPSEVFFGEMLAGTNFDEDETRKTSGLNGMGAKAANVFSTEFVVDHADTDSKLRFFQTYRNNGKERDKAEVTPFKGKVGYTSISFHPDYEYFGYPGMDDDLFALLKRYVYECAMITGLNITCNGEKIQVKDLLKYVRLYFPNVKENNAILFTANNGDECVVVETDEPELDTSEDVSQVSFVNGIQTRDGGVHVDVWRDTVFPILVREFNARKPKKGEKDVLKASAKEMYPYFVMFVRAEASDCHFDDQSKGRLNSPIPELYDSSVKKEKEKFTEMVKTSVTKMLKWNFTSLLEDKLEIKADILQARKEGPKKRPNIGKDTIDANFARDPKKCLECTLFITEGKSARTFAVHLISLFEDGTDYYGAFPIKGKFINVQNASLREINNNKEVQYLKGILRLRTGVDYSKEENFNTLRYGKVCILSDADDDGIHIRGLLLNFFYTNWPTLIGREFVQSFSTAVTIAQTKGSGKKKTADNTLMFYSNPEFHSYYDENSDKIKGRPRYLKGLGSHEASDYKLYMADQRYLDYVLDGREADYMDLGFNKKQSDWRKTWITQDMVKPGTMVLDEEEKGYISQGKISLSTFVDEQLIIYHRMALRRALPNIYDGEKEAQRKIHYGIWLDKEARDHPVNVEMLCGSVKKHTGYHHGQASLEGTIKKLAQGFVGSNNIPLLVNAGEFGTRLEMGGDAPAARYIASKLEDICHTIFHPMDEPLLEKLVVDGEEVEYRHFMPIIPMLLVNGADGIASGFSTSIPAYNPEDLVIWIEKWMESEDGTVDMEPLVPWYRGFIGTNILVERIPGSGVTNGWQSTGILEQEFKKNGDPTGWWWINEIPVGVQTLAVQAYLDYLSSGTPPEGSKKKKTDRFLLDAQWKGTNQTAKWKIKPTKDFIPDITVPGNFKGVLSINKSLSNMVVIDENNYPTRYGSPEEILQVFCVKRLEFYSKRKDHWVAVWGIDLEKENNRYTFVKAVVEGELIMNQPDEKLEQDMLALGLTKIDDSFDYLLSMQMRSMTLRRMEGIKADLEKIQGRLDQMNSKDERELWRDDLVDFRKAYAKFLKTRVEE